MPCWPRNRCRRGSRAARCWRPSINAGCWHYCPSAASSFARTLVDRERAGAVGHASRLRRVRSALSLDSFGLCGAKCARRTRGERWLGILSLRIIRSGAVRGARPARAMRRRARALVLLAGTAFLSLSVCAGEADCEATDPACPAPRSGAVDVVKAYVTAPLRWDSSDWWYFGGTIAAIAIAHALDG